MLNQYKISTLSLLLIPVIYLLVCCRTNKITASKNDPSIKELRFLGEYIIPHNMQFKNTSIGGLSGIDYDQETDLFFLISDDWSQINPARFYTARIFFTEQGIDTVQFADVIPFLQPDGSVYPGARQNPHRTPDPEAIRYQPLKKHFIWTSEGERFITKDSLVLQDPAIRIITKGGKQIDSFPLPSQTHIYSEEKGLRRNGTFEGLSFGDDYNTLYVSIEEPIYEDGPRAATGDSAAWTRVLKYNANNKMLMGQYAYAVDPVVRKPIPENGFKINGVSEVLAIGKDHVLFVERSYSQGRTDCNIRVYIGDINGATNIVDVQSLSEKKPFIPIKKSLLLNMDSLGMYIGNIEGVTEGPQLPNGHLTLIFVADNNFRNVEKTQFLLFEVVP